MAEDMTTTEILEVLAKECPNGVSFDPMAVRLLRQKVPFEDWQIEDLKAEMFQFGRGLWLSREMVSDDETRLAFCEQATAWLMDHGCFSVERLLKSFCGVFHHIATPEDCAAFLRLLGCTIAVWGKGGCFCFQPLQSLDKSLAAISETITGLLEEADGTLTVHEIEQAMPNLSAEALECIRAQFLPEVHATEIGEVACWCSTEAIYLPEDFSEKLSTAADTLVELEEKVSVANLEFALNLLYRIRFRKEYALPDNDTFMRVCAKHYQGGNDVFPNTKKSRVKANDRSMPGRRLRSPNSNLSHVMDEYIARVQAESNINFQYKCNASEITMLSAPNTFYLQMRKTKNPRLVITGNIFKNNFDFIKEVIGREEAGKRVDEKSYDCGYWDLVSPIESAAIIKALLDKYQVEEIPPPTKVQETKSEIIGSEGRPLSPSTWRLFRSVGPNPRVAEWTRRVENGESVENIASGSGLQASTVKQYIIIRRRYFDICQKNNIVPEGGAIV